MNRRDRMLLLAAVALALSCGGGSDALGPDELSFTVEERPQGQDDAPGAAASGSFLGIGVGGIVIGSLCSHTVTPTGRVSGTSVSLTVEVRPRTDNPICPPVASLVAYTALFRDLQAGQTYMVRVTHVRQPGNEVTVPFEQPVSCCSP